MDLHCLVEMRAPWRLRFVKRNSPSYSVLTRLANGAKSLIVPQLEISSRNCGSIQIVSPTLPFTDEMSSSAMPTSLKPAITNSRPTHLMNVDFEGKSG